MAPTLKVGSDDALLPLDCIQCQTVLAKCLGPLPEWEDRLRVTKESGYNMIHVTPVQTLGISNSSYSIKNHVELNPAFSTDVRKCSFDDLKELVNKMKNEWKVLTVSDVVWNHAAKNSVWLKEHPECSYNLHNSPHLRPAFLLDRVLVHFGDEVAQGAWMHRGLPSLVTEEYHMNVRNYSNHHLVLTYTV